MTSPNMLPVIDSPPRRWIDSHDVLANLTQAEIASGQEMGRVIDIEDPHDNGTSRSLHPMRLSNSMSVANNIKTALLDHGAGDVVSPYTGRKGGVSIELIPGRGTGGSFVARLHHHTASANISKTMLTPALSTVKNGRSDLQGPLANGYGGGDFVYRLITLEWANHPGLGGPLSFSKGTIPKDNGRPYLWGTEWDWNGVSQWPDEYLEWMARCDAGLADVFNLAIEDQGEHKTWAPLRKIDRNIITRASSIARTRAVYNTTVEDADVPNTENEIKSWVNDCLENKLGLKSGEDTAIGIFGQTSNKLVVSRTLNINDPASLASMLRALLSAQAAQGELLATLAANVGDDEGNLKAAIDASNTQILAAVAALENPTE